MPFLSRYMPCSECGTSVARLEVEDHRCEPDRRIDFELFQLRDRLAAFEDDLHAYLETAHGRFDVWLAARQVSS